MQGVKQLPAASKRQKNVTPGYRLRNFRENFPYLTMILPAVLVVFLFNYLPIYGVLIAFQDFMPGDKILSDTTIWVGFE
jgi:ABC-type polysaccharide transport system, permease component